MNNVSFNNTQIAFGDKNNKEMKRALYLFKIMSQPLLVKAGTILTPLAINIGIPLKWALKPSIFSHFCGGENIEETDKTMNKLLAAGIGTVLDYAAEGAKTETQFDKTKEELIRVIKKAANAKGIPFAVFKMTGVASFELLEKKQKGVILSDSEKENFTKVLNRVDMICRTAYENKVAVFIDAEESWIQNVIDDITEQMMAKYNKEETIVYHTLQLYRHDRYSYMMRIFEGAREKGYKIGLKIVRGAYMEKERKRAADMNYPSPIHATKADTDNDYDKAVLFILKNNDTLALCAATHNENSMMKMIELMEACDLKINNPHIYTAQLLGMSDNISYNMAKAGYNVAKYVPYGPVNTVVPYLMRRAQENTSVAGQTSRELNLIKTEIKRRKNQDIQ